MNLIFLCLAIVLLASQVLGGILNCDYCNSCNRLNPVCLAAQAPCGAAAGAFNTYTSAVWSWCAVRGSKSGMGEVVKAKKWLVEKKFFTQNDIANVTFRWCGALGKHAAGMTPIKNQILLNTDYETDSWSDLASLVGHELCHARQHVRWSDGAVFRFSGFGCRYGHQILQGHGTGYENEIEKECYDLDDKIQTAVNNHLWSLREEEESQDTLGSSTSNPVLIGAIVAAVVVVCIALIVVAVLVKTRRSSNAAEEAFSKEMASGRSLTNLHRGHSRGASRYGSRIGSRIGSRVGSRAASRAGTLTGNSRGIRKNYI